MNETNALWKDLYLFWMNLTLNSNQENLRQTEILKSTRQQFFSKYLIHVMPLVSFYTP